MLLKIDLLISSSFEYLMISLLSSFYIKNTNISLFIDIFISSLSGFTIEPFKTSHVSLSQSTWAFFITYDFSFFICISLNINLKTDRNLPWPWSLPTTISIIDIEVLSKLLKHSWQYKLSSDVIKIFEIGFSQNEFFYDQT